MSDYSHSASPINRKSASAAGVALLLIMLSACSQKEAPPPPPPPQVTVTTVREQPVTLTSELPGRIVAYETSEVRPQVNGLIQARLFKEGEEVRAGQALYQVDAAPYQAQVASSRAALSRAQAAIASTRALASRYNQLVAINAISRQDLDNARTGADQARSDVSAQQAAVRTAEIDLARTRIRAPITGRIGRSAYTTGALVSTAQTEPLATIQRIDQVYVDLTQSSAALLSLRQRILSGQVARGGDGAARVRLKLENGSVYPVEGRLQFADVTVDATTGSQTIRATFPNRQRLLLPGMYVRAELIEGRQENAILVPQAATSRDEKGNPTVFVVGAGNKAELRQIVTSRTAGNDWIVTSGLKSGDRVIMDGTMQLRPGSVVRPVTRGAGAPPAPAPQQR